MFFVFFTCRSDFNQIALFSALDVVIFPEHSRFLGKKFEFNLASNSYSLCKDMEVSSELLVALLP